MWQNMLWALCCTREARAHEFIPHICQPWLVDDFVGIASLRLIERFFSKEELRVHVVPFFKIKPYVAYSRSITWVLVPSLSSVGARCFTPNILLRTSCLLAILVANTGLPKNAVFFPDVRLRASWKGTLSRSSPGLFLVNISPSPSFVTCHLVHSGI